MPSVSNRSAMAVRGQLGVLARRVALPGAILVGLLLAASGALALSEDVGPWYAFRWALDTAATVGAPLLVASVGTMHSPESWAFFETSSAGTDHTHAVRAGAEATVMRAKERVARPHTRTARRWGNSRT